MWYSDGTIEIGAAPQVATGTGTAFLKNVRVGDGLTIVGSASMHEVTNIASDTQLTFSPPYAGAVGAGKQYRIAPIQGYVKEAADLLRSLTKNLGDFANSSALKSLAALQGLAGQVLRFKSPGELEAFVLGTAAARDLTASATDITAGRLLKTGDGGWMGDIPIGVANVDDRSLRGWRYVVRESIGTKPSPFGIMNTFGAAGDVVAQEFFTVTGGPGETLPRYYRQSQATGGWGPWAPMMIGVKTPQNFSTSINSAIASMMANMSTVRGMFGATEVSSGNRNWNDQINPGCSDTLMHANDLNGPSFGGYAYCISFFLSDPYSSSSSLSQIALGYGTGPTEDQAPKFATRTRFNGQWSPWRRYDVEYGSNGNGRYVRLPDGTQFCYFARTQTAAIDTAHMGGFRTTGFAGGYPASFIDTPVVTSSDTNLTGMSVSTVSVTATSFTYIWSAVASQASAARTASFIAMGRWK